MFHWKVVYWFDTLTDPKTTDTGLRGQGRESRGEKSAHTPKITQTSIKSVCLHAFGSYFSWDRFLINQDGHSMSIADRMTNLNRPVLTCGRQLRHGTCRGFQHSICSILEIRWFFLWCFRAMWLQANTKLDVQKSLCEAAPKVTLSKQRMAGDWGENGWISSSSADSVWVIQNWWKWTFKMLWNPEVARCRLFPKSSFSPALSGSSLEPFLLFP